MVDYVDENTRYMPEYDGPGHHCDECGREYGYYCVGPVKFGYLFVCKDCKRELMRDMFDIRDNDLGE